jgi:hypothetical protein
MRLALWLAALTAMSAAAQTPLTGWRQHVGDDPRFAQSAFDDAAWPIVPRLYHASPGIRWHRLRIEGSPGATQLFIGAFTFAYEVWIDGQPAGRFGSFDSAGWRVARPMIVPLPRGARTIAVRSFMAYGASPAAEAYLGSETQMEVMRLTADLTRRRDLAPMYFLCTSLLVGGLFFLLTPLWRGSGAPYLWCGLYLLFAAANRVVLYFPDLAGVNSQYAALALLIAIATVQTTVFWSRFCLTLFGGRLGWLSWIIIGFTWVSATGAVLDNLNPVFMGPAFILNNAVELVTFLDNLRSNRWRVGPDMRVLAAVTLVFMATSLAFGLVAGLGLTELSSLGAVVVLRFPALLFMFAMGILLSQRSARLEREQGRLQQELAAAGEMQALLWPPDVPGIEAAYLPAAEVGGDFYQVLERDDGSRVVLVGDVSGKGLRAAMLVSVAIGILRREPSSSPAAILRALNAGLTGHAGGGFVTCCCLRLGEQVTAATAGHPAPYTDGREAAIPCGLPLGIVADADYEEAVLTGSVMTLVSDGVLEAANAAGELFGFERTREISTKSAAEIAEAARAWGQNDDITVVTVRRTG